MSKSKDISIKLDKASLMTLGGTIGHFFVRYAVILFFVLVAGVYAFVVLQINTLSNAQPSQADIDAQTKSTTLPRIDPKIAEQLEQLEDNSVNVQTLFEQARNNPFQ